MKERHTSQGSSSAPYRKTKVRQKSKASEMRKPEAANPHAVTLFEPEPLAVYPIEAAARIGRVPRRMVLVYCKYGLISPLADPKQWGYWFTADAIRTLRRIDDLRTICGDDLPGIAMILELLDEVQALRAQIRAWAR
jgi:hypothetical protein